MRPWWPWWPWWLWWPWELKVFLFPWPACDFSLHQEVDGSVSAVYAGDALHGFTAQWQRSAEIRSVGPQASHRDAPRHRNCEVCHRRRHHMSTHVNTCHMSHVITLDASQQLQTNTPNLQGNNMEQHEQLNLTKLLPKLLTTVKGPFCVLPIEPAGTAQMLLGGRINLGLKLRVRTWFKMIEVSDSMRRSKIRNHQKGHLETSWNFNIPPKNQCWSMLMPSGVNPESQLLDMTQLQRKSSDIDPRGWKLLDRSQVSQSLVTSFRCRGNSLFWMASMVPSTAGSSSNLGLSRANNRWLRWIWRTQIWHARVWTADISNQRNMSFFWHLQSGELVHCWSRRNPFEHDLCGRSKLSPCKSLLPASYFKAHKWFYCSRVGSLH